MLINFKRHNRRNDFSKEKRLSKKIKVLLITFFLLVGIFAAFNLLKIKSINIQAQNLTCTNQDVLSQNLKLKEKNLLLLNTNEIESSLKQKFICIKAAKTEKKFPQTVTVNISNRKASIILNTLKLATNSSNLDLSQVFIASETGKLNIPDNLLKTSNKFIADESGFIFSEDPKMFKIPVTDFLGRSLKIGEELPSNTIKGIKILKGIINLGIDIKKSLILDDRLLLIETDTKIIFNLEKDYERDLASLQLILQKAKMSSIMIDRVDLRFDKPIVIYSPEKN